MRRGKRRASSRSRHNDLLASLPRRVRSALGRSEPTWKRLAPVNQPSPSLPRGPSPRCDDACHSSGRRTPRPITDPATLRRDTPERGYAGQLDDPGRLQWGRVPRSGRWRPGPRSSRGREGCSLPRKRRWPRPTNSSTEVWKWAVQPSLPRLSRIVFSKPASVRRGVDGGALGRGIEIAAGFVQELLSRLDRSSAARARISSGRSTSRIASRWGLAASRSLVRASNSASASRTLGDRGSRR